jgi:hypothetical protein
MSTKTNATLAAFLIALAIPGAAAAQSTGHAARSHKSIAIKRLAVPPQAFGSVAGIPGSRGRYFETDPDPNVRFEMNRDDRDRREK